MLRKLKNETTREFALRVLKQRIIHCDILPGTLLSEKEFADELGISRTPVREAMIELSQLKIIEIIPQKGSRVSYIDLDLVEEASFLRRALESAVIEMICEQINNEDLVELEANITLQKYYQKSDPTHLYQLDNEFHEILFRIANKMQSYRLMQEMNIHFDRLRWLSLENGRDDVIVLEHESIVEAIKKKDVNEARDLVQQHLTEFKIDGLAIMENHPEYFMVDKR